MDFSVRLDMDIFSYHVWHSWLITQDSALKADLSYCSRNMGMYLVLLIPNLWIEF